MPAKRGKGIIDTIKGWFFPKNTVSATAEKTLKQYGDVKITDIEIKRKPIFNWINRVLNFISLGKWEQAKQDAGYDKMFHLSVILTLENGKKLILEKNEKINLSTEFRSRDEAEYMNAGYGEDMTVSELLKKTQQIMGDFKFYQYNAFENNCQDFVTGVLKAAKCASSDVLKFVKQDMASILKSMPDYVGKINQFVTDSAGKVSEILGKGRRRGRKPAAKKTARKKKVVKKA